MVTQAEQNVTPQKAQAATGINPHQHQFLFPLDFSGRCIEAARHVRFWASRFHRTIFASHVVDPGDYVQEPHWIKIGWQKITEMTELENRVAKFAADGRYEPYKVSLKFDNPEARLAHNFPLDMQSKEVKEMVRATENTGKPFPPAK